MAMQVDEGTVMTDEQPSPMTDQEWAILGWYRYLNSLPIHDATTRQGWYSGLGMPEWLSSSIEAQCEQDEQPEGEASGGA